VGDVSLERLRKAAGALYGGDLVEACGEEDRLLSFRDGMKQAMAELASPAAALEAIIRLFNYKDYISRKYFREASKAKAKMENVDRFLVLAATLCEDGLSAEDLVFQLTMDRATEEEREGEDDGGEVVISTIHSAKGLEWRRVYVTNVTEGSLPHRFSMSSLSEIEEERRLFYVACTRAKDALAICVHEMEQYGPSVRNAAPSRFLAEIGIA
jgi:DNA helicase-2/ATP-dependent DNA helicase PcrA